MKYIIVYQIYTSFYNEWNSSTVSNKALDNYEVEASSRKEAYEKFKEYADKEEREARMNRDYKHLYYHFTILNIIDLEDKSE